MTDRHGCDQQDKCVFDLKCPHSAHCWGLAYRNPEVAQQLWEVQFPPDTKVHLGPACESTTCQYAGTVHGHGVGIEMGYA